jgi:hypothetical protein
VIEYWINLIIRYLNNNGPKWTIERLKIIRLVTTRYIAGSPYFPDIKLGMTKDGIPRALGPMVPLLRSREVNSLQFVLTMLNISKIITWWGEPSYSTITEPPRANGNTITDGQLRAAIRGLRIPSLKAEWSSFHLSTKMGPVGQALVTANADAQRTDVTAVESDYLEKRQSVIGRAVVVSRDYLTVRCTRDDP